MIIADEALRIRLVSLDDVLIRTSEEAEEHMRKIFDSPGGRGSN